VGRPSPGSRLDGGWRLTRGRALGLGLLRKDRRHLAQPIGVEPGTGERLAVAPRPRLGEGQPDPALLRKGAIGVDLDRPALGAGIDVRQASETAGITATLSWAGQPCLRSSCSVFFAATRG
jgi:hypothetical protein